MKTTEVVRALAALAQGTRLELFRSLVRQGPAGATPGALAEKLDIANATLSFHLKELSNAGLIRATQEGRFIYYAADYEKMGTLLAYLTENCCGGQPCMPAAVKRKSKKRNAA